jgi:cytochrome P450
MVVLTSPRLIKQLLDKKSSIYSNRPTSFVADLITSSHHTLVMNYSPLWKLFRKLIHQSFSEGVVEKKHTEVVNAEACQMVYDMMVKPEEHMLHPKRFSNSVIMSLRKSFPRDLDS